MYCKNTHALECNFVLNFKKSAKNFRRFKILGDPRDTLCLPFFNIIKTLLHKNGTFFKNLKAISKELLDLLLYTPNTPVFERNFVPKFKRNRWRTLGVFRLFFQLKELSEFFGGPLGAWGTLFVSVIFLILKTLRI